MCNSHHGVFTFSIFFVDGFDVVALNVTPLSKSTPARYCNRYVLLMTHLFAIVAARIDFLEK